MRIHEGASGYLAGLASRYGMLMALVAGLLLPLAFAPFGLAPVATLSLAALLLLWQVGSPRLAAWRGFAWGCGAFLAGLYWLYISLHVFGKAPLWLAVPLMLAVVAIMALYPALAGYLFVRVTRRGSAVALVVFFPCLWVLLEWIRGWFASGFPWLALGYSQSDTVLAGLAPIGGVYLVSFAVALSAGGLVALTVNRHALAAAGVVLLVWVAAAALEPLQYTTEKERPVKVSLVQGSVPQDKKWLPEQLGPTLELYREMTLASADSDLVIWPEAAVPALLNVAEPYLQALWQQSRVTGTDLLIGIPRRDPATGQFFNSVIALGEQRYLYDKRHLVPFGEYFPVPGFVRSWMRLMNLPYTDFAAGSRGQAPIPLAGETLAITICYEDVFGALQLPGLHQASMLVNVSNDAWFGDSIAPHQHLQIARLRALETRRPMLRATNTGISAIIGAHGQIVARTRQFQAMSLDAEIRGRQGTTPYMVLGDWLAVMLAVAGMTGVLLIERHRAV